MKKLPTLKRGTISRNVSVECVTIRDVAGGDKDQELRLQGRLKNVSSYPLDDVRCDLSYFAADGTFLGLDATSFVQDEIDLGEAAPFDLQLSIPATAVRCVFNVHAKRVLQDVGVALQGYVSRKKSGLTKRIHRTAR